MRTAGTATFLLVFGLGLAVAAGEGEPTPAPSEPGKRSTLSDIVKGLRDRLPGDKRPGASADASSAPQSSSDEAAVTPAPAKVKDFKVGSKLSSTWNDSHCRNLVEPFDIADSAASLAKLKLDATLTRMNDLLKGSRSDSRADIRAAAQQLNWLPMSAEREIGSKMHDEQNHLMREGKSGAELYARARRILADVTAQIREANPYQFVIYVTTDSGGNAESAPGGFIYVDRDLVDKPANEPRARFAIAHEVSHVLQRHRTRETQMRLSDSVNSIQDLTKLMASTRAEPGGVLKKGLDTKRMFVRHSEEQELQADGCAVRLVDAMSANKAEMIKSVAAFVEGLPKPTAPEPRKQVTAEATFTELTDGQFSRHPSTQERIKNLNAVLADLRAGK